ncbi:MAG: TetR/AcrR family transcriptional regulator [Candidatus Dormibacteraeota bacterium]|jgi:AcrR family transcriptional regulator|nr:TetR/AcrR family transcriptional regulator [Candidatus Dormibacteraeota bacterium]
MDSQGGGAKRGRTRNRRGEGGLLRLELIEAARRLLEDSDSEGDVTLRAVTRLAGVAPQSFYLQFGTLEELLYEVYQLEYGELGRAMALAAESQPDARSRLLAACRSYCDFASAHPAPYRAMTAVRGKVGHRAWEGRPLPGAPTFELIRNLTSAALKDRNLGSDPHLVAATVWASLHGTVTLRSARPAFPWPPLDRMIEAIVDHALA